MKFYLPIYDWHSKLVVVQFIYVFFKFKGLKVGNMGTKIHSVWIEISHHSLKHCKYITYKVLFSWFAVFSKSSDLLASLNQIVPLLWECIEECENMLQYFILINEKVFGHLPVPLRILYNSFYRNSAVIWELNEILSTLKELIHGL